MGQNIVLKLKKEIFVVTRLMHTFYVYEYIALQHTRLQWNKQPQD